jgi:hypothetical protein
MKSDNSNVLVFKDSKTRWDETFKSMIQFSIFIKPMPSPLGSNWTLTKYIKTNKAY